MRTDTDRRRALKLAKLRRECEKLAHQRTLLRQRLADVVRLRGWSDAEAGELKAAVAEVVGKWSTANESVRQILQEHREPPVVGNPRCFAVRQSRRVGGA